MPRLTMAGYVGAELPADRVYDGHDVGDLLAGKTRISPRNLNYYYQANLPEIDGIWVDDWKLLLKGDRKQKGKEPQKIEPKLFNLKEDPSEKSSLYSDHP